MQTITELEYSQAIKQSSNDLSIKGEYWHQGRKNPTPQDKGFIYDAFQVDCNGFEYVEIRMYSDGSSKFLGSK